MKQEEYRSCMTTKMGGGRLKGLSKEDRRIEFCSIAKECSKGVSQQEAARLCAESAANPKPPREKRARRGRIDTGTLAACVIKGLDGVEPTLANLPTIIAGCTGQKAGSPTREKFIKKCFKENSVTGDIKEAQKLRSLCTARWKEQEATA